MRAATIEQITGIVRGRLVGAGNLVSIRDVSTDTRTISPGSLFIAIKGDRYDGNRYLKEAADHGAVAAIISDESSESPAKLARIVVDDTRIALGQLAAWARQQLAGKVIAVAGSNGKTSTKYLIDSVLRSKLRGSMSPKSFNNDIGVPLTILPAKIDDEYLVLELGTNHPGEIANLTRIANPDIAVITNCGAEHLEFLGDLTGVRRENASILQGLRPNGALIVNGDDEDLLKLVSAFGSSIVRFGFGDGSNLIARGIRCEHNGTQFTLAGSSQTVSVPMIGKHAALNALATIAVARRMGMRDADIFAALATASSPDMRMQLADVNGVSLLNDAYNANPNSMRAALETMIALPARGRRIAILGDMRELGPSSEKYHRELGKLVVEAKIDRLACVGTDAKWIAEAANENGMASESITRFIDAASASKAIPGWLNQGDLVLLKASRSVQLETVAKAIAAR